MKKTNDITQEKLADVFKAERAHLLRYACYRLGNEDDAKDVLQDTFLKLHTRIADADDLQINNLRSYIFRTLTNICAKWKHLPIELRLSNWTRGWMLSKPQTMRTRSTIDV